MDTDLALALQLQQEYDAEQSAADDDCSILPPLVASPTPRSDLSPVDPQWETLDPNPDVRSLFLEFNQRYFWGKLDMVEVRWSPRMTLCAGLCVYEGRGGLCSVRLSAPLLKLRPRKDLVETLLHEMIHALLFVTDNNKDHDGHGPEFHKHMYRINKDAGTSISVYHSFHDEVDNYRVHWWKCNGPCQKRPPYFGMVKRSMNRPPSPRDTWWGEHQRSCGGTYTKIKEPEGFGEKKSKKKENTNSQNKTNKKKPDIRNFMGVDEKKEQKDKTSSGSGKGIQVFAGSSTADDSDRNEDKDTWTAVASPTKDTVNDVTPSVQAFTGTGHVLGSKAAGINHSGTTSKDNNCPAGSNGVIVRRIPGIGIITSSRPVSSSASEQDNSSRSVPAGHTANSSTNPNTDRTESNKTNKMNRKSVVFENVDVSDSEDYLPTNPKHKRSESQEFSVTNPPGTAVKIPGFRSVCTGSSSDRRHLNSVAIDHAKSKSASGTGIKGAGQKKYLGNTDKNNDKPRPKRPVNTNNFAADRNKRVLLDSSDSDTDDEEFTPLISAVRKSDSKRTLESGSDTEYKPRSEAKKFKLDSDSDDDGAKKNVININIDDEINQKDNKSNDPFASPNKNEFPDSPVKPKMDSPGNAGQDDRDNVEPGVAVAGASNMNTLPNSAFVDNDNDLAAAIDMMDPLVDCPACSVKIRQSVINEHLDRCLQ